MKIMKGEETFDRFTLGWEFKFTFNCEIGNLQSTEEDHKSAVHFGNPISQIK